MTNYRFLLLDICAPDYFNGYSGDVLAIPVDSDSTKEQLSDLIKQEYNSQDSETLPELSDYDMQCMCDAFILAEKPLSGTIEKSPEDDTDPIYMYFTVV